MYSIVLTFYIRLVNISTPKSIYPVWKILPAIDDISVVFD